VRSAARKELLCIFYKLQVMPRRRSIPCRLCQGGDLFRVGFCTHSARIARGRYRSFSRLMQRLRMTCLLACFVARTKMREVEGMGFRVFLEKGHEGEVSLREALYKRDSATNLVSKTLGLLVRTVSFVFKSSEDDWRQSFPVPRL
jgi:hypothetical protein